MRAYIKLSANQAATQISVYKLTANTKVLYLGDKFRIADNAQEYAVTGGDVTTDGNGKATINFTPGLIANYNPDETVQIPDPRPLTSDVKTKIGQEQAQIIYFVRFDFDSIFRITNIVQSGSDIRITSAGHGLSTGNKITIDLPLEYAGEDYTITKVDNDTFTVVKAFDADAPTTGTYDVKYPLYLTTAATDISWNSLTWLGIGAILQFNVITETGDIRKNGVEFVFSGVEPSFLATLLTKAYAARNVTFWGGFLNDGAIVCDPALDIFFRGKMVSDFDAKNLKGQSEKFEITFRAENRLTITDTAIGLQTNVNSHQQYEPDSKLFDQIPKLINKPLKWGKIDAKGGGGGGCFFWAALTFTTVCGIAPKDHPLLETLRNFRDTKMDASIADEYKEIAPKIVAGIEKNPCGRYVYAYIRAKMEDAAIAIGNGEIAEPVLIYNELKKSLTKFIG
ncbi:MAG: hypothetical protein NG747_13375 [Candidatus Brocadia sp.]|nr:hypothetical protein [Candidatus Brocadia sp.]